VEPTPEEMKAFAARFTKDEWDKLCANAEFISLVDKDLAKCRPLAEKILAKK
jgi:hypothetical protein